MLSIISPHFNDVEGIKKLYTQIISQTSPDWEWIIVDDCSSETICNQLKEFFLALRNPSIYLILNSENIKASACRNKGAALAKYNQIVFVDSDDSISPHFVANRKVQVDDFVVFQNFEMYNETECVSFSDIKSDFLNNFFKAKFGWQTSAILWDITFFKSINGFDEHLILLEDIELSIRALIKGSNYKILINNEVDFYYKVAAINIEKRDISIVCDSVEKLLVSMNRLLAENDSRRRHLSSYYYLAIRYFVRAEKKSNSELIGVLKRAKKVNAISLFYYVMGYFLVLLHHSKVISNSLFLKLNRHFFKCVK